jgi:hypothetical protein
VPAGNPNSDVLDHAFGREGLPDRAAALAGYLPVVMGGPCGVTEVLDRAILGTGLSQVNALYSLRKPVSCRKARGQIPCRCDLNPSATIGVTLRDRAAAWQ